MAAPLVQRVTLDSAAALRELAQLEQQLTKLDQPIGIPVSIEGGEADFAALARSLGISEDHARSLTDEFNQSRVRSREVEQAVRGVAQALGLSEKDAADLARQLQRSEQSAEETSNAMLRVGTRGVSAFTNLKGSIVGVVAALGLIQGARLLGTFAFDAVQSASNLDESLSKTNVVFGQLSGQIQRFASTAPKALGLSTQAALEATSTFGNLFVALGLSQQAAADLSPDIIQLAADLASFNNISVDEAVEKLRSGLVGEVEPLRTLGVNLNAATVEAKAMSLGFTDASGAVTEAGKVQARYALILEQTTTAQGDFARTADGIANSQRTLTAEFEDAKTKIGQALVPAFRQILEAAPALIEKLVQIGPALGEIGTAALEVVGPLAELVGLIGSVIGPLQDFKDASQDLAISENPFDQLVGSLREMLTQGAIANASDLIGKIGDAIDGVDPALLARTLRDLADAAKQGRDPAMLLAEGFRELNEGGAITVDVLEGLLAATGAVDEDLTAFLSNTIRNAARLGLSADEIRALKDALNELNTVQRRAPGAGRAPGADPFVQGRAAVDAYRIAIEKLGGPMDQLQRISQETGFSIDFIAGHTELFGANVAGLVSQLGGGELVLRGFSAGIEGVADSLRFDTSDAVDELDLLVNKVNEAGEEIPQTVRQMNDDLRAQADQLATVEAGTVLLDLMGLTSLAAEIRGMPVEDAAQAVEKYLADSVGAVEANDILLKGGNPGEDIIALINEAIAAGNATPAMLDYIAGMTSELTKADFLNSALTFSNLTQGAFQDALNALHITLPADFIRVNTEGFLPPTPGSGNTPSSPTRPSTNPFVAVYQTFEQTPDSNTATTRAAAEIAAVVSGVRGV